ALAREQRERREEAPGPDRQGRAHPAHHDPGRPQRQPEPEQLLRRHVPASLQAREQGASPGRGRPRAPGGHLPHAPRRDRPPGPRGQLLRRAPARAVRRQRRASPAAPRLQSHDREGTRAVSGGLINGIFWRESTLRALLPRIQGGPRAARKPGSVPPVARGRWPSIWDAGLPAPLATATRGLGEQPFAAGPLSGGGSPSYLVLLRAGFTWPAGHPTAGGLLPHQFTLAGLCRGCHFCGTFLRVTPTGYSPALCSAEPGLSPPSHNGTERPPVRLGPGRSYRGAALSEPPRRLPGWLAHPPRG